MVSLAFDEIKKTQNCFINYMLFSEKIHVCVCECACELRGCRVRGRVPASDGGVPGGKGRAPRQKVEEAEAQS